MMPTLHQYAEFAQAWHNSHATINTEKTYEINHQRQDPTSYVVVVDFMSWRSNTDATEVEIITAEFHEENRFLKQETKKYILTDPTDIACIHIMLNAISEREEENEILQERLGDLVYAEMLEEDSDLGDPIDLKYVEAVKVDFSGDWRKEFVQDCYNF